MVGLTPSTRSLNNSLKREAIDRVTRSIRYHGSRRVSPAFAASISAALFHTLRLPRRQQTRPSRHDHRQLIPCQFLPQQLSIPPVGRRVCNNHSPHAQRLANSSIRSFPVGPMIQPSPRGRVFLLAGHRGGSVVQHN